MQTDKSLLSLATEIQPLSSTMSLVILSLAKTKPQSKEFRKLVHQLVRLACTRLADSCVIEQTRNETIDSLLAKLSSYDQNPKWRDFVESARLVLQNGTALFVERMCRRFIQLSDILLRRPCTSLWVGSLRLSAEPKALKALAGPKCTSCYMRRSNWVENGHLSKFAFLDFQTPADALQAFEKLSALEFNVHLVNQ